MIGILPKGKLRAMAALVAAYALALQAVFATLAPMQVQADGTVAVYCSTRAIKAAPDSDDPAGAPPATGKLPCVFCGACAAGSALLPEAADIAYSPLARPLVSLRAAPDQRAVAFQFRDGPARAPPLTV